MRPDYYHQARIQLVMCRVDVDVLEYRIDFENPSSTSLYIRPLRGSANGLLKAGK